MRTTLALLLVFCTASQLAAQQDPLRALRREHPRLLWTREDVTRVREQTKTDEHMKLWHQELRKEAERVLKDPKPVEFKIVGPRLLGESRKALYRITLLAGLYQLEGDVRFAERAKLEMFTAADFKNWNPTHFLDVAEMTNALALGYDWLYHYLTPAERQRVREAMIKHGLKTGLEAFESNKPPFWTRATHNWSNVCNGGLTMGALAIADEEPELATKLLAHTRKAIIPSMGAYAPDGGFGEGPGYWRYATSYTAYYLGALRSALGTDDGFTRLPGFAEAGMFRIHSISPAARAFNYADAGDGVGSAPELMLLGQLFNQPVYTNYEIKRADRDPSILHLIWYRPVPEGAEVKDLPTTVFFRGPQTQLAFMRSDWNADALYIGIKGGDNRTNHSHLDIGTFVLDSQGERFALDLGPDDYNLPGFFGKQRWTYFRLRTEAHNTLTFDGQNQATDGKGVLFSASAGKERSYAVYDLSSAYREHAEHVIRGVAMINRDRILFQDEIAARDDFDVRWNMLTKAATRFDGANAEFTQGKAKLYGRIIEPAGAKFVAQDVSTPPAPNRKNPGVSRVQIELPAKLKQGRIVVVFSSDRSKLDAGKIVPLSKW